MGCTLASGELNRALQPLFLQSPHVHIIQDDIIVAGKTEKEHDTALDEACKILLQAGLTLNSGKCIIKEDSIPWWGMRIGSQGISPDPTKVEAVKRMTPPKSKDEVKSFFCMIQAKGYGKDFIPNLAQNTKNIRELLKKNTKFNWTDACNKEFLQIKEEFSENIMMRHFNPKL